MGRFCLNCGHPIGEPPPEPLPGPPAGAPTADAPSATPPAAPPAAPAAPENAPRTLEPLGLPVQAADPTPVPPVTPVSPARPAPNRPAPESAIGVSPGVPPRPESQWDPREDLLPYEEVDDLERDTPLTGLAWIAWVLGAVLLVGLVFVLLQAFGTDGEDTATDPATSASSGPAPDEGAAVSDDEPETTEGPTGVGKRFEMATDGTFDVPETAPPTTDFDGNLVAYEASQLNDGDLSTAWRMAGDATGQTLTLTLAEPGVVHRVGLVNGYSKQVAGVDWYPNNRRILSVTWVFEDGSSLEQTFAERTGLQMLKVPPVQTATIGIQLTSVTPPGSGNLGRDYTAISEVSVIGRRAG